MPSELQQNRYDQLIRRVGGIVGPGSKVSEALTELFPVIDVEDRAAELAILGGTGLGFGATGSQAAAGETSKIQLFNPVESGQLVTITRIDVETSVNGITRYGIEGAARGTPVLTGTFADSRLGIDQRTTATVHFQSSVGLSLHSGRLRLRGEVMYPMFSEKGLWVLAPGTGLTFNCEVDQANMNITFFWRERVAEQSELNF